MREWLDGLTGWQMFGLLGAAWFAVAVALGIVSGKLMALQYEGEEKEDDRG